MRQSCGSRGVVPGGHDVVVVDSLDKGANLGALGQLPLVHLLGHLREEEQRGEHMMRVATPKEGKTTHTRDAPSWGTGRCQPRRSVQT